MGTLAQHMDQGAAFYIDHGFAADESYRPQRTGGTLMCHQAHRADPDPLDQVGAKDITTHAAAQIKATAAVQKLLGEHDMGELFKVVGFVKGGGFDALGSSRGDRTHLL